MVTTFQWHFTGHQVLKVNLKGVNLDWGQLNKEEKTQKLQKQNKSENC